MGSTCIVKVHRFEMEHIFQHKGKIGDISNAFLFKDGNKMPSYNFGSSVMNTKCLWLNINVDLFRA